MTLKTSLKLEMLLIVYQFIRQILPNGFHELIGDRYRDVKILQMAFIRLGKYEIQDIRVIQMRAENNSIILKA